MLWADAASHHVLLQDVDDVVEAHVGGVAGVELRLGVELGHKGVLLASLKLRTHCVDALLIVGAAQGLVFRVLDDRGLVHHGHALKRRQILFAQPLGKNVLSELARDFVLFVTQGLQRNFGLLHGPGGRLNVTSTDARDGVVRQGLPALGHVSLA